MERTIYDYLLDRLLVNQTYVKNEDLLRWTDAVNSLIGRRLASRSGGVDYNYTENAISFSPGGRVGNINDSVIWNMEYNHDNLIYPLVFEDGTTILPQVRPHMHYTQGDGLEHIFVLRYRVQYYGHAKTTAWSELTLNTLTDLTFPYVSGDLNQIGMFKDGNGDNKIELASDGSATSATLQFQMWRTDNNGGDILVEFVDSHVPNDGRGSIEEYVKQNNN